MTATREHRIDEEMRQQGLNQNQLAERMGTAPIQISRLLSSKRRMTLDWMTRFARALGVTVGDLLTVEDNPHRLDPGDHQVLEVLRQIDEPVRRRVPAMLSALAGSAPASDFETELLRRARALDEAGRARLEKLMDAAA